MASALNIIDRHQQLYGWSCPAAAVELVLKLHGRIGGGYRKLQDAHPSKTVGFAPFRDRIIRGLHFYECSWNGPAELAKLDADLRGELAAGRFPIVGLLSGARKNPDGSLVVIIHEWVVVGVDANNNPVAVSKSMRKTTWKTVAAGVASLPFVNALFYR